MALQRENINRDPVVTTSRFKNFIRLGVPRTTPQSVSSSSHLPHKYTRPSFSNSRSYRFLFRDKFKVCERANSYFKATPHLPPALASGHVSSCQSSQWRWRSINHTRPPAVESQRASDCTTTTSSTHCSVKNKSLRNPLSINMDFSENTVCHYEHHQELSAYINRHNHTLCLPSFDVHNSRRGWFTRGWMVPTSASSLLPPGGNVPENAVRK